MTRGVHDLGGLPAGPVDRNEHERTFFDQRADAMMRLLSDPVHGYFTVDAMIGVTALSGSRA
jgi:nitrile hydratase subunit beta